MKLPFIQVGKKTALVSGVIVLGLIGGVSAEMANQSKTGADTSPLVTEVDHQNDRLNNHEARITNLEGDTKALQSNTNTAPSGNRVSVPDVRATTDTSTSSSTSASTPADPSAPASVTVVAFREIVIDPDNSDCEYTYSDGTTYQFHWKTYNPQASWQADSNGQNGHWVGGSSKSGYCDNRAIGQPKS